MTPTQQLIAKLRECETNPTVIAMLERAIVFLNKMTELSGGVLGKSCLADLDALAREALKEKTDGK